MMSGGYGFGFGLPGIGMWIFWILLIVLVVWAARAFVGQATPGKAGSSALEILRARYARGEIDRDEYESKRRDLTE